MLSPFCNWPLVDLPLLQITAHSSSILLLGRAICGFGEGVSQSGARVGVAGQHCSRLAGRGATLRGMQAVCYARCHAACTISARLCGIVQCTSCL